MAALLQALRAALGRAGAPSPALRQYWQQRSLRERRLLQLAAGLLALALAWSLLLQPALQTRRRAPAQIAALQQALLTARAQAQQWQSLRRLPDAPAPHVELGSAAAAWLRQHQQTAPPQPLAHGLQLQLQRLPAAQLLELVTIARRDWGAEVGAATLEVDAERRVSGSVELTAHAGRATP